jgi:hypothetical protein
MRRAIVLIGVLSMLSCGCRHEQPLPAAHWNTTGDALATLRERAAAVRTVSSQGLLTLRRPDGESVRFDVALVSEKPNRVRVRAWKLGRAIFDLTLNDHGLFLFAPADDPAMKQKVRSAGVTAGDVARSWATFNGALFDAPDVRLVDHGGALVATSGATRCEIDRRTLLPRRYEMRDDRGVSRFTLDLTDYRSVNGVLFPHRYAATSDTGTILIALTDVELNGELPPAAFAPPKRAEKLP